MKTAMAFGSFDILHPGHLYFLKKAKALGDKLIVVVAKDSSIKKIKGKDPKYPERKRLEHVRDIIYVDKATLGYEKDHFEIVEEINPDIIALGYDQITNTEDIDEELKKRKLKATVVRIDSYKPEIYKSSKFKEKK